MPSALPEQLFERISALNAPLAATMSVVTSAFPVANLTSAVISFDYLRNAGSVTGYPLIGVQLSRDPPNTDPNTVSNWSRVRILDGAAFAAGTIPSYAEAVTFVPTSAGSQTLMWPDTIDVAGWFWLQVLATDFDAGSRGVITVYAGGA